MSLSRFLLSLACMVAALAAPVSPAQESKSVGRMIFDRLPFEVIVTVAWQGRTLEVRRIVSCDQRRRTYPGPDGLRVREVWDQSVDSVYYVLPSREVLIFRLPYVCRPLQKQILPLRPEYLPVVLWVDNADAPQRGEEIVSHRYFDENPKRRFAIRSFRVAAAAVSWSEIDDEQRLVWLLRSAGKPDAYFVGVSASAIPKEAWKRFTGLAAELEGRASGPVARRLIEQYARPLLTSCEGAANGSGVLNRCITGPFDDREYVISATQEAQDVWRLDFADVGVRRYRHLIDARALDSTGCNPSFPTCNLFKGTYRLIIGGATYEIAKSPRDFIFDAKTQQLIIPSFRIVKSSRKH